MSLSLKKRIALRFMTATAIIIAAVFITVFFTVKQSVYEKIDDDLSFEANKHTFEVKITEKEIHFINKAEWEEKEHTEVEVNPVFIQIINEFGEVMDKSPNLKNNQLIFKTEEKHQQQFNSILNKKEIRQIQIPIHKNEEIKGYILAAMDLESSLMVLSQLKFILLILYPLILLLLFFISSFLAGKSIAPIVAVINTTDKITNQNLKERVKLPENKDVLYNLSESINSLLDRIEEAIDREKQFTSDASHELRTPLSVLKGTLEVLIRKPRSQAEYEEKIKLSLAEIDRMSKITEQLLLIARFNSNESDELINNSEFIDTIINDILRRKNQIILLKNMSISLNNNTSAIKVNSFYTNLILENILDNAIKYSNDDSKIIISIEEKNSNIICQITDFGIGIKSVDLNNIFNPFFRSESLQHKSIKGNGLGLSIVSKSAKEINAKIEVNSKLKEGTVFTIILRKS